jgi:Cobalamin biosynthesis protein CobT (nicotinate-mononucleotide:5, 6-dimethylbenzimidazole phosphoribosyltransferase)
MDTTMTLSNRFVTLAPENDNPAAGSVDESSKSDMDILDDIDTDSEEGDKGDEETEPRDDASDEDAETDETDEDAEKEPEDKAELEEGLEEADKTTVKAVTKKYPNVFKEFPELRQGLFLSRQYQEIFATPDEAIESKETADTYNYFQDKLLQGSSKELLQSLKESGDVKSYQSFVDQFLPTLFSADQNLYYQAVQPVLQTALYSAFKEGVDSDNKNLALAARWISKWLFNNDEMKPPTVRAENKIDPERQRFLEEKARWETERFGNEYSGVAGEIYTELKKNIMKDIDPNNQLGEYTRKKLMDDVVAEVGKLLESDKAHIRTMDSLWDNFRKSGMPRSGKTRIKDTYLARALRLLPGVKSRLRAEALGRKTKSSLPNKANGTGNRPAQKTGSKGTKGKLDMKDTKGMSDMDILNRIMK